MSRLSEKLSKKILQDTGVRTDPGTFQRTYAGYWQKAAGEFLWTMKAKDGSITVGSCDRVSDCIFGDDITDLLDPVWQVYGCLSMFQLEALAHREDPWRQTRGSCRIGDACTSKISPLAILRYYSKEQQEWEKKSFS